MVNLSDPGISQDDLLVHDAHATNPSLAFMLSRLGPPRFPTPIGIFRSVEEPVFDQGVHAQIQSVTRKLGPGSLQELLYTGDTWTVK